MVYVDDIAIGTDGKPCYYSRAVPEPAGFLPPGTDLGNFNGPILNPPDYPRCPVTPGSAVSPRTIAALGWNAVKLPAPRPSIAPGRAITGKTAYLETHGSLHDSYSADTPVGPLRIDSTGTYVVDWGDGQTSWSYSSEGGPWPDGQITHVYEDVGTYDVVVTEHWTADWRIGGASGHLTGQQTAGRIDDFPVEQVQAVVTAG
ncbi:MAG: hypothetical protein ABR511_06045 [Acidimicrobiales bacterium]